MKSYALLICGDRNWSDAVAIQRVISKESPVLVIHGAARGADSLGGREAQLQGIPTQEFPAQWEKYGRGAGPMRNEQMLDYLLALSASGWKVKVYAFHSDLDHSRGTKDMVTRVRKANIDVEVIV